MVGGVLDRVALDRPRRVVSKRRGSHRFLDIQTSLSVCLRVSFSLALSLSVSCSLSVCLSIGRFSEAGLLE